MHEIFLYGGSDVLYTQWWFSIKFILLFMGLAPLKINDTSVKNISEDMQRSESSIRDTISKIFSTETCISSTG